MSMLGLLPAVLDPGIDVLGTDDRHQDVAHAGFDVRAGVAA